MKNVGVAKHMYHVFGERSCASPLWAAFSNISLSFRIFGEMERRKVYNRVPASLPTTTRWHYASSVSEWRSVSVEDSLSFAEKLSKEGAHPEDRGDIDSYFEELGMLAGIGELFVVHSKEASNDLCLNYHYFIKLYR